LLSKTNKSVDSFQAVSWSDGHVRLLDQRVLPQKEEYIDYHDVKTLAQAITDMVVRGAPAIGIAAAYAVVLAARDAYHADAKQWREIITDDLELLAHARPTAVNLQWAIDRMRKRFPAIEAQPEEVLLAEAIAIHEEDIVANQVMGKLGAELIQSSSKVLTHCNAGALATGGYGTALGVIRSAYSAGTLETVFACETRPWLQGARLTAWELQHDNIPVTLIADSAASHLLQQGEVKWIIVGADRIAANGDVVNKIGTYALAVSARHHGVRFMVVAPISTIDLNVQTGAKIPIEKRASEEITRYKDNAVAPEEVSAWNPAFDVTPAELVDVIVTEKGIVHLPDKQKIAALFTAKSS